jgi:decaprenylphospho-beta-D-erythro-pentofuranosid-2-ulose 2-reductase
MARARVDVQVLCIDCLETEKFDYFVDSLPILPNTVISVVGELGEQARAEVDVQYAGRIVRTNFEGPALLLQVFAARFMARGFGVVVGVSSVAGDRGRGSNYVYGAAKAGFSNFLSGLRSRLSATPIHVLTVKPGYVRTGMTAGLSLPSVLTAEPMEVGRAIFAAAERRRRNVIYVKPIWRPIMAIIRAIPEPIFKYLRF